MPWRNITGPQVLLITSRETRRWILPKGWPMRGLPGHLCAAQEAYEEAGVRGAIDETPIGHFVYAKKYARIAPKQCRVEVYPLLVDGLLLQWPEAHERTRRWFGIAQAAELLMEPDFTPHLLAFFAG